LEKLREAPFASLFKKIPAKYGYLRFTPVSDGFVLPLDKTVKQLW
jgi:hypothetical protein